MSTAAEATVATLRAGDDVDAVFACSRKDRLTARSGSPYLAIELRDRTGAIQGRAFRDADLLDGFLEHLAGEVHDPEYRTLLETLLADEPLRAAWRRAPCTRGGHHAYLGGLLEHTVAVGTLALEACQLHPRLNSDLLLCAALVHDLGRTREFTYGADITLTEEGRLLGHVAIGQRMLDERAAGMSDARRLALAHCVLCHHGPDA